MSNVGAGQARADLSTFQKQLNYLQIALQNINVGGNDPAILLLQNQVSSLITLTTNQTNLINTLQVQIQGIVQVVDSVISEVQLNQELSKRSFSSMVSSVQPRIQGVDRRQVIQMDGKFFGRQLSQDWWSFLEPNGKYRLSISIAADPRTLMSENDTALLPQMFQLVHSSNPFPSGSWGDITSVLDAVFVRATPGHLPPPAGAIPNMTSYVWNLSFTTDRVENGKSFIALVTGDAFDPANFSNFRLVSCDIDQLLDTNSNYDNFVVTRDSDAILVAHS